VQRIGAQVRTVHLVGRQPAQLLRHRGIGDLQCFIDRFSLCHIRDHRRHCYRGAAAERLELHVLEPVLLHLYVERHHIAADRVAYLADAVSILYLSDVPGILEMVHHFLRVEWHCSSSSVSPLHVFHN
jgi:hypothetical protein